MTEWGTRIQPPVQWVRRANPEVQVVIPIHDSMSQIVVPALRQTGTAGAAKAPSSNGTPFVLECTRDGALPIVIGGSLDRIGCVTIESLTALNVPFDILDQANGEIEVVPARFRTG